MKIADSLGIKDKNTAWLEKTYQKEMALSTT